MELLFGLILGFCFGASLMLLVAQFQIEKVFKGWQETIDAFHAYHDAIVNILDDAKEKNKESLGTYEEMGEHTQS